MSYGYVILNRKTGLLERMRSSGVSVMVIVSVVTFPIAVGYVIWKVASGRGFDGLFDPWSGGYSYIALLATMAATPIIILLVVYVSGSDDRLEKSFLKKYGKSRSRK